MIFTQNFIKIQIYNTSEKDEIKEYFFGKFDELYLKRNNIVKRNILDINYFSSVEYRFIID